ncbi:putative dehydrogenase [Cohnella sp. SGD-V74]|uniref:Gfo/Idh/MocA family protein n=1 Tax=unclassified Cohnella TaxID=2636738 RepID=UPI000D47126A|nr:MULTISPECIES: Gfo/Idh/MocA family oxidoreductase [unclassified Cohnella]PRX63990.1 putative dehydrogenase [Cohnella sp. SGD-V74]
MVQRIYMVGAGAIARLHAKAICKEAEEGQAAAELHVTDSNPAAVADFVRQFPEAVPHGDLETMLAEPARDDDIVIVATPPVAHAEIACRALASGRHALCEKPLAVSREEAARMLSAARKANRLLGCCSSRFAGLPTTGRVKELLARGELGRIYQMSWIQRRRRARSGVEYQPESRWFLRREISGGGTLMDWGPYDIAAMAETLQPVRVDVLHAWTANPRADHPVALAAPFDVEQHVGALLQFHLADGSRLPVRYERAACCHGEERTVTEIEGTEGGVSWDWLVFGEDGELIRFGDEGGEPVRETSRLADATPDMMDKPIVYFRRAVAGLPSRAIVGEQAVFNFGILAAIYDCARTGEAQSVELEEPR